DWQGAHQWARHLKITNVFGGLLFFSHNQQNSATDQSKLVLESLEKSDAKVAEDLLENLDKLFSLMEPNSPERVAFISRALKWSSKEQNCSESWYHLHSIDGQGCVNMLVEYSLSCRYRSEMDIFVAQAILQFLCLKNETSASVVSTTYTQKQPSIQKGQLFLHPLLNFIWFLLLAVHGEKLTVQTVLYPLYNEYLDRIGQLFFGVLPKQTSSYRGLVIATFPSLADPLECHTVAQAISCPAHLENFYQ
uniref:Uncharacterized protein n=1 Tax=Serinus canaria TaxID=9135 RepID=A0A8C9NFY1_SERCA